MALPKLNSAKYDLIIPSTGQEVEFRPYLVKEEKILMIALESQDQRQIIRAVKDVIKGCVFSEINVDKLALFDIEYIFLNLRSKSVGESIELKTKCSECETVNDFSIKIPDIKPPVIENENVIELTDTIGVTMRYPSITDIEKMKMEDMKSVDGISELIMKCIDSVYDDDGVYDSKSYTDKELREFIDSFNTEQFMKLAGFFNDLPTIKLDHKFNCISCKKANEVPLRGLQSFFT